MTRSIARDWTRAAALAVTAGIAIALTPVVATAAPSTAAPSTAAPSTAAPSTAAPATVVPATADQARKAVTDAGAQLEVIGEKVNEATAAVQQQQAAATAAGQAAAQAEIAVQALEPQLRAIAQSGYVSSTPRIAAFLTSGSAAELMDQMSTLSQLAVHADAVVARVAAARDAAAQAQQAAATAQAQAQTSVTDLTAQQAQLRTQLSGYQANFTRLSAADQATVQAALAGPVVAVTSSAPAPTAAAGVAVQTALAQLGKPYVPGASGPDAFDCSGLTMYAYAKAGITLPHSSAAQAAIGVPVARADLQPGDLVFFYSPISHVGMYIGHGQMVHASVPGKPVAVTSVDKGGYVKAIRVTG